MEKKNVVVVVSFCLDVESTDKDELLKDVKQYVNDGQMNTGDIEGIRFHGIDY